MGGTNKSTRPRFKSAHSGEMPSLRQTSVDKSSSSQERRTDPRILRIWISDLQPRHE